MRLVARLKRPGRKSAGCKGLPNDEGDAVLHVLHRALHTLAFRMDRAKGGDRVLFGGTGSGVRSVIHLSTLHPQLMVGVEGVNFDRLPPGNAR